MCAYTTRIELLLIGGMLFLSGFTGFGISGAELARFSKTSSATNSQTRKQALLSSNRVADIVERAFGGLLQVDNNKLSPSYLVGDFNGDGIEDIVICVRLKKELDKNDVRSPSFNLTVPLLGTSYGSRRGISKSRQFTLGQLARLQNFSFLIIVHGQIGREFQAVDEGHKFVLMNTIQPEANRLSIFRGKLRNVPRSGDLDVGPAPHLIGDAVLITTRGIGEALYWDHGEYSLYPIEP